QGESRPSTTRSLHRGPWIRVPGGLRTMPSPSNTGEFIQLVRKSGLVSEDRLALLQQDKSLPATPGDSARYLIEKGWLTRFQADHLVAGRWQGMQIGPYHLLEMIGKGGTGLVFKAQHAKLRNVVAIKVLPPSRAHDEGTLQRFLREGRAVAALNHPNIVGGLE